MQKNKIIVGTILGLFVILFILSIIFPPVVKFHYILGEIDYQVLLGFAVLILIIIFIPLFDEKRDSKIYLDSNGNLDVESPREYKPIKITPISKVLGRANIFGQKNLDYFYYRDRKVTIRNSKGHEISGPLDSLEYSYKMDKNRTTDEWYIYQFKIKDNNGNKVQFNRHNTLFNDEEYADIEMLLSLAGDVKESKVSKLTRKLDKIVSSANELDFHNLFTSSIEQAGVVATENITNKAGQYAKKRIYDRLSDRKKSVFRKIIQYFIWIIIILIFVFLIWLNIEVWQSSSSYNSDSDYYEYQDEVETNNSEFSQNDGQYGSESEAGPIVFQGTFFGTSEEYDDFELKVTVYREPRETQEGEPYNVEAEGFYNNGGDYGSYVDYYGVYEGNNLTLQSMDPDAPETYVGTLSKSNGRLVYAGTIYVNYTHQGGNFHLVLQQ